MDVSSIRDRDTVLIIDDDAINRELLGEFVDMLGYDAVFASNGQEGLERLAPDIGVVLLDIMMPDMDGFEVTRRIRMNATCNSVPIILVTALTNRDDKLRGVEAGANDFITKPIDMTELRVRLNAQFKMKRAKEELNEAREQEVAVAAEIQSTMLLGHPPTGIPGARISAFTASSAKIDGDFYHFFVYDDRHFDIAVGDVMGKGIPAAVLGAAVKSAIQQAISRGAVDRPGSFPTPAEIVSWVHGAMTPHLIRLDTFVTLAYAHVDLDRNVLTLVDCGHTSIVHFQIGQGGCSLVQGDNLPLGVMERESHITTEIGFEPGDVFVLYSDGITEAEDAAGELFGVRRLSDSVGKHASGDPDSIIRSIRSAVRSYTGTTTISDDITCVVLKIGDGEQSEKKETALDFLSSLDNLSKVSDFVREFFSSSPHMLPADVDALELVVDEAVVNVIEHGYSGDPNRPISILLELTPTVATVRIMDWADPFDPSAVAPPTLDGSRFEGFGVFIIQQNTSEATYSRDNDGTNCSTFIRNIPFHQETQPCT